MILVIPSAARDLHLLTRSLAVVLLLSQSVGAQSPTRVSSGQGFDFTIKNIMRGPELYGRQPSNVRWSADNRSTCAGFCDGGRRVWYVSEFTPNARGLPTHTSGAYAHRYSQTVDGKDTRQLTSGNREVLSVALSPDTKEFFLTTSEPSPFEKQFYRMPVSGGARTRITQASGGHTVVPSPDGRLLADVYSYVNQPPDLFLQANIPGATPSRLTTSPSAEWLRGPESPAGRHDTLAYRRSSPIYFAEGLRDPLLMLHGMVDVNVQYQDIVRLTQRLIELGKTDWELASYPVEDHAFVRPSSWTDEYTRIFNLFERTIGRRNGSDR